MGEIDAQASSPADCPLAIDAFSGSLEGRRLGSSGSLRFSDSGTVLPACVRAHDVTHCPRLRGRLLRGKSAGALAIQYSLLHGACRRGRGGQHVLVHLPCVAGRILLGQLVERLPFLPRHFPPRLPDQASLLCARHVCVFGGGAPTGKIRINLRHFGKVRRWRRADEPVSSSFLAVANSMYALRARCGLSRFPGRAREVNVRVHVRVHCK